MPSSLDIIIVNRNSGNYLRSCLRSIESTDKAGVALQRVCVVDDVSTDDSLHEIGNFRLPLQLILNDKRRGYGSSCNRGAAQSHADYLLFLNSDVCLTRDSLRVPLFYMENGENSQVAITGITLLEDGGEVSRSCAHFPTVGRFFSIMLALDRLWPKVFMSHQMKEWDHLNTREVDQVMGAFMMMRRSVFEQLKGYDERFFVYMEDLDLSLRTNQLGFKSVHLSGVYAYHKGGGSARRVRAESLFFNLRSRIQYGFKHLSSGAWLVLLGTMLIEPLSRLALAAMRQSATEAWATIDAYSRLWRWLLSSGVRELYSSEYRD